MFTAAGPLARKWAFFPLGQRWRTGRSSLRQGGFTAPIQHARAYTPPFMLTFDDQKAKITGGWTTASNIRLRLLGDPLHNSVDVDARTLGQGIELVHVGREIHVRMSLVPQSPYRQSFAHRVPCWEEINGSGVVRHTLPPSADARPAPEW
jgi:hypothetical protein